MLLICVCLDSSSASSSVLKESGAWLCCCHRRVLLWVCYPSFQLSFIRTRSPTIFLQICSQALMFSFEEHTADSSHTSYSRHNNTEDDCHSHRLPEISPAPSVLLRAAWQATWQVYNFSFPQITSDYFHCELHVGGSWQRCCLRARTSWLGVQDCGVCTFFLWTCEFSLGTPVSLHDPQDCVLGWLVY